jgi:hypothetical protein
MLSSWERCQRICSDRAGNDSCSTDIVGTMRGVGKVDEEEGPSYQALYWRELRAMQESSQLSAAHDGERAAQGESTLQRGSSGFGLIGGRRHRQMDSSQQVHLSTASPATGTMPQSWPRPPLSWLVFQPSTRLARPLGNSSPYSSLFATVLTGLCAQLTVHVETRSS